MHLLHARNTSNRVSFTATLSVGLPDYKREDPVRAIYSKLNTIEELYLILRSSYENFLKLVPTIKSTIPEIFETLFSARVGIRGVIPSTETFPFLASLKIMCFRIIFDYSK